MNFGNIIFIGLLIIVIISNVAKAVKKAQATQPKPLVGRPLEEAVIIQKQKATPVKVQRSKPKTIDSIPASLSPTFVEGERILNEQTIDTLQIDTEFNGGFNFPDREEIKKGIIFSEIFNRKY